MSPQVFAILRALIEEKTGIHYSPEDADLFRSKVAARALERGYDSLLDYYYLLRYDDAGSRELDALIDVLVVPETYFFREFDALKLAVTDFVKPLVAQGKRPRIWCAACATGEEPLTITMLLADANLLGQVDIVASDMSLRALARARTGEFGARALRQVPDPDLAARFVGKRNDAVHVSPELIQAVDFRRVNLMDRAAIEALGTFDVILCRNVLIYFSDETAGRVVRSLEHALEPGGVLLVGVSESLLRFGTSLACEERRGTFIYRTAS